MEPFFLVVTGPTAVGKTELIDRLCAHSKGTIEVINADMGQLYGPLAIGTAKPDWRAQSCPHHLFDVLHEPVDWTVHQYREHVARQLQESWGRGALPIIVGGSGFYLKSLFFPPPDQPVSVEGDKSQKIYRLLEQQATPELVRELIAIDPVRAARIDPHDRYRIVRALHLWHTTHVMPSQQVPVYRPLGRYAVIFLTRDREDLYARINARTAAMVSAGWLAEVEGLDQRWREFLKRKKLIGYAEIIQFLEDRGCSRTLLERIQTATRQYAKRQITFWRSLEEQLTRADTGLAYAQQLTRVNLTFLNLDLYIDELWTALQTYRKLC